MKKLVTLILILSIAISSMGMRTNATTMPRQKLGEFFHEDFKVPASWKEAVKKIEILEKGGFSVKKGWNLAVVQKILGNGEFIGINSEGKMVVFSSLYSVYNVFEKILDPGDIITYFVYPDENEIQYGNKIQIVKKQG